MLKRSFALILLIVSAPLMPAQDPAPTADSASGGSSDTGSGSVILPSGNGSSTPSGQGTETGSTPTDTQTQATTRTGTAPAEEKPSFSLPGGYGSAPLKVTPGEGLYARPPISFSATVQQGYTDNVYSTSGIKGQDVVIPAATLQEHFGIITVPFQKAERVFKAPAVNPVQGSLIDQVSLGSQILFSASRVVLSMNLSGGGSYYWDRAGTPFSPSGTLGLIFAYKVTPRSQFSATVTGAYYNQPNLTIVNGPTQPGTGDYIIYSERFDLSHQFTGRISTDTTLTLDSEYFMKTTSQGGNYLAPTLGESFSYSLSPRTSAVLEVRASQANYQGPNQDSSTQFLLFGADLTLTRRCSASFRMGETLRQYQTTNSPSASSPYAESSLTYGYGKASSLSWTNRFGFEQGAGVSSTTSQKTFRSNLGLNQVFSAKLSGNASIGYSHSENTSLTTGVNTSQDTLSMGLGAQFILNRSITLFANFSRSQVFDIPQNSYSVDQVFLGATYQF